MRLVAILGPLNDLRYAFFAAVVPTLKGIFNDPLLVFHPKKLSNLFFSHVWELFGDNIDAGGREIKLDLIKGVHGVVLDIGAGATRSHKYHVYSILIII